MNKRYNLSVCEALSYIYIILYPIAPAFFKLLGLDCGVILSILYCMLYCLFCFRSVTKLNLKAAVVILSTLVLISIPCLFHSDYARMIRYFFEYGLVIICLIDFFKKPEHRETTLRIIVLTACIMCLFGVYEFVFGHNLFEGLYNDFSGTTMTPELQSRGTFFRSETTFGHAIPYGIYLSFCGLISYYLLSTSRKKIYIFAYVLILVNLFMTLSRGPIVFFFGCQLLFLWMQGRKKLLNYTGKALLVAIAVIAAIWLTNKPVFDNLVKMSYIVLSVFSENAVQQIGAYNNSNPFAYRIELFSVIPKLVNGHWLFGLGRDSGTVFNIGGYLHRSIDNAWLCFILNYGIIGLLGYTIMVLYPGIPYRHEVKKNVFSTLLFCLVTNYFLNLWSVAMMTENRTWVIIFALSLAGIKCFTVTNTSQEIITSN